MWKRGGADLGSTDKKKLIGEQAVSSKSRSEDERDKVVLNQSIDHNHSFVHYQPSRKEKAAGVIL